MNERMFHMTKRISIKGMSCGHCKAHVENALRDVSGVQSVNVSLKDNLATVELAHEVDHAQLIDTIKEVGYEVTSIEG